MLPLEQHATDLNTLIFFLARRDIARLSRKALLERYSVPKVDLLILLGNSSLYVAEQAAMAFKQGLASAFMICGGKGHSTRYLADNVQQHPRYGAVPVAARAEADILSDILVRFLGMEEEDMLLENQSTNCGANAREAYTLLGSRREHIKTVLLMQDPVLQLRSSLSFGKVWEAEAGVSFISYAAFVPTVQAAGEELVFTSPAFYEFCSMDRYLSLLMGEIPRLRDDEEGYGPRGKGFIQHIDIPGEVQEAYARLLPYYRHYLEQRKA
jgi:uncharacterized SAM-binding protein YcdF (DUF218 family)